MAALVPFAAEVLDQNFIQLSFIGSILYPMISYYTSIKHFKPIHGYPDMLVQSHYCR
jgi:hypothetical protein